MKYEINPGRMNDVNVHRENGDQNLESSSRKRSGTLIGVLVDLM